MNKQKSRPGAVASTVAAGALDNAAAGIAAGTTTNATGGCKEHLKQGPALESNKKKGRKSQASQRQKQAHKSTQRRSLVVSKVGVVPYMCKAPVQYVRKQEMSGNKRNQR